MQLWDIEQATDLCWSKVVFNVMKTDMKSGFLRQSASGTLSKTQWQEVEAEEIYDDPMYLGEPGLSAMKIDHEFACLQTKH